jgi:putative transcriptional regulator
MPSLAGSFLIARPVLQDPSFKQTVVLLLQHSDEGAFGLVVNRPRSVEGLPFPLYAGGPCPSEGLFMVHGQVEWMNPAEDKPDQTIAEGIYLGDSSCIGRVNEPQAVQEPRYRLFTGYAGWGPDQLEHELAASAWAVVSATPQLLFDVPAADLWSSLLPPSIPQPSLN